MKRSYRRPVRRGIGNPVRQHRDQLKLVANQAENRLPRILADTEEPVWELEDEQEDTVIGALVRRMRRDLAHLDDHYPTQAPDPTALEALLAAHQAVARRRQKRDLTVFLMLALVLVSGMAALLYQLPVLFIALQVSAVLLPIGFWLAGRSKHKESRWRL